MLGKRMLLMFVVLGAVLVMGASLTAAQGVTLTVLTHWGEDTLLPGEQALLDECSTKTGVTIDLQTVGFNDLLTKIVTGQTAGTNPDIFHLYNLWLPDFATSGLLSPAPQDVIDEVTANAPAGVIDGVTSNGQIWGWPTEVNTYLLIYNKKLLAEAGYTEPPATWDELKEIAAAITKKDDTGAVTQVGYGVLPGWDSGIVHPFAALLMSDGGEYLNTDGTATAFDSAQGLETLQLYSDLLSSGAMDMSLDGYQFLNGKVGMTVMANWWRSSLMASDTVDYDTDIGVAPVPVGPSGSETATMSYNWLWSVASTSQHQEEAWNFIKCMGEPRAEGESSPMGDYLVNTLGAIPSMIYDQEYYADALGDFFLQPYVESTSYAMPEPVVAGGQEVKTKLQAEIEGVLNGLNDPQSALDFASSEGDTVLQEMANQ